MTGKHALFDLGEGYEFDECPNTAIPTKIWAAIDLFWLCYARTPGFAGWVLTRNCLPGPGSIEDQERWMMSAFQLLEGTFYQVDQERQGEAQRAKDLAQTHEKVRKAR